MADRSVTVRLKASVSDYTAKMSAAGKATADLAAKVEAANAKTRAGYRAIGLGATVMGGAVVAGFGAAGKAAADFDSKMALVQTLLKAAPSDMAKMRVAALHVGQAYGYTAGQVADAEAELAKAGIGVKEQLGGALVGALTLAAAGQMDVAQATEVAAAAMTQFHLQAKDVPHIADLLAAGADRALGSVADLGEGLAQAGPVAHQFGLSIEETIGTLTAFAESGQIGERGGTIFSQMLLKLASPSKAATADLKHLNISLYDAQGQFVGITSLAGQLHDKMANLDDATRNTYLAQIFGARAIKGAAILYREGAAGIEEWITKVNAAGFAELQASGKLNSLSGDWLKFKAAIGAASIEAGEPAQGPLRTLVQDATSVVNAWEKIPGPIRETTEVVVLVGGAITLAGGAALLAVPKFAEMNAVLEDMGVSAISARTALAGIGKATLVAGVVLGIGQAVNALDRWALPAAPDVDKLTASLLSLGKTGRVQGELLSFFGSNLSNLDKQLELASQKVNFGDRYGVAGIFGDIAHAAHLPTGWDQTFSRTQNIEAAKNNIKSLDSALAQLATQKGGMDVAKDAWNQLSTQWVAAGHNASDLVKLFPQFASEIQNQANNTGNAALAAGNLSTQLGGLTKKTRDAAKAAQAYNDKLHAAADPLFAMSQALQDVHSKQEAVRQAVAKYGADSAQARHANLDLASSLLEAQAAASTLAGAVKKGSVSMDNAKAMLHAFIREGGLSKAQAHDILGIFQGLIDKSQKLNKQKPHITVTADTTPAQQALANFVSTLRTDTSHVWGFVTSLFTGGSSSKPQPKGRATGGGLPEGWAAVGEQGPELVHKSGASVQVFSHSQSKAMAGMFGSVPGFAKGTPAAQRYENRLRSILHDRGSSPAEVRHAVLALNDLATAWDTTLRHIGNAQQLHQLKRAVEDAKSPAERASAERQLEQFRKQRQQDAATRRIQAAQDLATNKQTWLFERMSVTEQIRYLDKAMAKEKKFSDQWLQDAEQRRSLRQSQHQDLKANKQTWLFENMTTQQQIAYLDKKIAKEKKYSDQWLADMEQRKSLLAGTGDATTAGATVGAATYTTAITVPDRILGTTYTPWTGSRGGDLHVHFDGPVYGADQQSLRNLSKQLAPMISQEQNKTSTVG